MARIIGIDPGSSHTGWGVIDYENNHPVHVASGVTELVSQERTGTETMGARCLEWLRALRNICEQHRPTEAAVEAFVFFGTGSSQAEQVGEIIGVTEAVLCSFGIPLTRYTTQEVKAAVTLKRTADKKLVAKFVARRLGLLLPASKHATDALAVALCHTGSSKRLQMKLTR